MDCGELDAVTDLNLMVSSGIFRLNLLPVRFWSLLKFTYYSIYMLANLLIDGDIISTPLANQV
jgi:hypothetical protein